jgi:Leucine-rich repeat (LRR) protein
LNAFRTKLETLALPNNHIEDLDWLKVADPAESISLKTIDLTGNNITDLQYEDFQDLSAETTIIIKDNPINNNLNKIQNFTNGISASGVKAKFVFA